MIVAALAVALLTRGDDDSSDAERPPIDVQPGVAEGVVNMAGLPVPRRVAFVIDPGSSSASSFEEVADLISRTIAALPGGARFQVVLWQRPDEARPRSFPGPAPRSVSRRSVTEARRGLADAETGGTTAVEPALALAFRGNPDAIVLVTAKGDFLFDDFADRVLTVRDNAGSTAVVHVLAVETSGTGNVPETLRKVADLTGGTAVARTPGALRQAVTSNE